VKFEKWGNESRAKINRVCRTKGVPNQVIVEYSGRSREEAGLLKVERPNQIGSSAKHGLGTKNIQIGDR